MGGLGDLSEVVSPAELGARERHYGFSASWTSRVC